LKHLRKAKRRHKPLLSHRGNTVEPRQIGKKLTAAQADELKTDIANLRSIICCQ
jgi:hypothetical protein